MKNEKFIGRLIKNRFQSSKKLRELFETEKSNQRHQQHVHPKKLIKGVYRGNFYRIKIPPHRPPPKPVAKLLNPSSPPVKGFVHAEAKKAGSHPTSSAISELRQAKTRAERQDIFNEYWDSAKQWWKLNWAVLVLNFGSVCSLVGFTRSDVLELRCLSVTGSLSSVAYFASLPASKRSMTPILWSLTFACVNSFKIAQILVERKAKVEIPEEHVEVFRSHFQPHGITPKQFEYILEKAQEIRLKKGQVLIREGDPLKNIYLITKGHTRAHHLGRKLTAVSFKEMPVNGDTPASSSPPPASPVGGASGGKFMENYDCEMAFCSWFSPWLFFFCPHKAWVGEMAFLDHIWYNESAATARPEKDQADEDKETTKDDAEEPKAVARPPTATERAMYTIVALEDDTTVLYWSHADMLSLMNRPIDMKNALTQALTSAIVGKVVGFTLSRKSSGGGNLPWVGRLWQGSTQGPSPTPDPVPVADGPPKVKIDSKPKFSVPELE